MVFEDSPSSGTIFSHKNQSTNISIAYHSAVGVRIDLLTDLFILRGVPAFIRASGH